MQGVRDAHWELWRAHGLRHRTSILYCICCGLPEQGSFQDDAPRDFKSHICHGNRYMMVRRLLSVLNWDPTERKRTKGGRLLIPRGVQFGPKLFPEIVIPRNHAGPLFDSTTWQDAPTLDHWALLSMDTICPSFPGDLELFTAEEVASWRSWGFWTLHMHLSARCFSTSSTIHPG